MYPAGEPSFIESLTRGGSALLGHLAAHGARRTPGASMPNESKDTANFVPQFQRRSDHSLTLMALID